MRRRPRWIRTAVLAVAGSIAAAAGFAQTGITTAPTPAPSQYPSSLPKRKDPPPPPLAFRIVESHALPDALSGGNMELSPEGLRVPVKGGTAIVDPEAGFAIRLDADPPPVSDAPESAPSDEPGNAPHADSRWVESPDGKRRFRTLSDGRITAEKRCARCEEGFKHEWSARLPGPAVAEPLVRERHLFVGALDTRVHCLRSSNGHRVWSVDVGDRVLRPVVYWSGAVPGAAEAEALPVALILTVGQSGAALVGLDPYDGRKLVALELPPVEGRLAAGIAVLPDGRILLGRETYAATHGDLLVVAVERAPETPSEEPPRAAGSAK